MRPLEGVRVLELGGGITAAYCTQIMATLGAEVIKVETPDGDETRRLGPFPRDVPHRERSGLFLYLNRNKKSITLDISCSTGQHLLRELSRAAAVVVENFAPSLMESWRLGYNDLRNGHEQLVMTSITPYGQDGPCRDYKGTEITMFAMGGLMNMIGDIRREPLKFGGSPMMYSTGLYAFSATMVALYLAEETGLGQHVDVSIFEAMAASHFQDMVDYEYQGAVRRRGELRTPIPCADGLISFTVQAHHWSDFRRLILGARAGTADAGNVIDRDRRRLEGEMDTDILLWAAGRTKYEAYRDGQEAHIPTAYIADVQDLVNSPQYRARGYLVEIDHPEAGRVLYPGFPAAITGADLEFRPAPLLGQDTSAVLSELVGLSEAEIDELRAAGVC